MDSNSIYCFIHFRAVLIQQGDNFAFALDNLLTATLLPHLSSALLQVMVLLREWRRRASVLESKIMTHVDFHVSETTGNKRWIVFNSLIFVLESLDYCWDVFVQVITLISTPCEPVCSVYLC